ncbi:transglutaminaseTgpA domain-containing protein [Haladaptatus sp. DYF46]|uniref:transglutaminase TgpA family protein n=1 Tax=Haladaptatus sp. DYF46 TaxID=2886041 RepID=UPI001E50342F|nr:transglutaminaseTgpA domain-containing protein [Haladaptatus sp. DYF46]
MSTAEGFEFGGVTVPYRGLAMGSTAVLIGSYLTILYDIANIAGDRGDLLLLAAGAFVGATLLARKLPVWVAFAVGTVLFVGGMFTYYATIPGGVDVISQAGQIIADNIALLTGLSILEMRKVGAWALGVAPATVFVPWYLVCRRRYVLAAASGGIALAFFVLTGDAGSLVTLAGMLGALGIVAFGTMARYGGTVGQIDVLVVALVAMILLSATMSVVPGGRASPILSNTGGGSGGGGGLVSNSARLSIQGSIELSPKVQYTVTASDSGYWKVASYDRYTGKGWIQTSGSSAYERQSPPPGSSYEIRQTFTVKATRADAMPAAWKPIRVLGNQRGNTRISSSGSLSPKRPLTKNQSYSVVSQVPSKIPSTLRNAGTDYPSDVRQRYTHVPESTSERLKGRTAEITNDAENPYDEAVAIEEWLETNKEYSLDVERPNGNVADSFVFDMDEGYCVYYATSMVVMLRTQGIPARFVTGYTSGQRTSEDTWVVRGLNSHAWVEVYFPDTGWVRFDPTPTDERVDAEQSIVETARTTGKTGIDAAGSENGTWTTTPATTTPTTTTPTPTTSEETNDTSNGSTNGAFPERRNGNNPGIGTSGPTSTTTTTNASAGSGGVHIEPPSKSQVLYAGLLLLGLLLIGRRTGLAERAYRSMWVRWQPRDEPDSDVERAFDRLEYHLSRKHRKRRPGETPREYISSLSHVGVDERAKRVGSLYEKTRYAGEVTRDNADEAVSLVNDIVRGAGRGGTNG